MSNGNEQNQNYLFERVKTGEFFKDSRSWFYGKYVYAYKQKFDLIILLSILAFVICVFVAVSVFGVLSVSAKNGVLEIEGEFEDEFILQKIPKHYNNNETNILRFIIENYVNYFESYDVDQFSIYKLNDKIKDVREKSTKNVGDKFERLVRNNYTTEVFAGLTREARIKNIEFEEQDVTLKGRVLKYILPEKTSNKVKITLTSVVFNEGGKFIVKEEERQVELTFIYKPLQRNKKDEFDDLAFKVTSYNYL